MYQKIANAKKWYKDTDQQEQVAALTAYTLKVTEITGQEAPLLQQKQNLEARYNAALSAAESKLTADKTAAHGAYPARCG